MDVSKWYAIVPMAINRNWDLTDKELRIYIEISSLCASTWTCWASDRYFAEIYDSNKSTISRTINSIYKKWYISKQIIYKEGSKQVEKRIITLTPTTEEILSQKWEGGIAKNETPPILKNERDNNINNINNNKLIIEKLFSEFYSLYPKKKTRKPSLKKYEKIYKEHDEIMKWLWVAVKEWKKLWTEEQYIPNPLTFLNQERRKEFEEEKKKVINKLDDSVINF